MMESKNMVNKVRKFQAGASLIARFLAKKSATESKA